MGGRREGKEDALNLMLYSDVPISLCAPLTACARNSLVYGLPHDPPSLEERETHLRPNDLALALSPLETAHDTPSASLCLPDEVLPLLCFDLG